MSFFIITSKFTILLKKFDDWNEWFLIVKFIIKSDDIKKYVNLTETVESSESSKPKLSSFWNIVQEVTSTANLIENQRRDLSMMREDVKKEIRAYRERKKTLRVLNIHILIIVDRINLLYLTDEDTVFKKLLVLKKRLALTDRIRELEIIRKFQNLQNRSLKNQQIDQWLLKWEKIYAQTTRLKISDVQVSRSLYAFLNALRSIDVVYVIDREAVLEDKILRDETSSIKDLLKSFRNHIRTTKALSFKESAHSHSTFATLQKETSSDDIAKKLSQQQYSKAFSHKEDDKQERSCVCDEWHQLRLCYYLIESIRSVNWKPNSKIEKFIRKNLSRSEELKRMIHFIQRKAVRLAEKKNISSTENIITTEASFGIILFDSKMTSTSTAFFVSITASRRYILKNCWILNSDINIHVCNDSARFKMKREADGHKLLSGKNIYDIEGYEIVNIIAKRSLEQIKIKLLNAALFSEFFTSLVSLSKFIVKNHHWNIEHSRLHHRGKTFCYIELIDEHWILENSSPDQEYEVYGVSSESKPDLVTSAEKWHAMLEHSDPETIKNLKKGVDEIKITEPETSSKTIECETCALIKAHHMMSRRSGQEESAEHPLERVRYDLIQMTEAYNDHIWISHFRDFHTGMKFVYTHARKNDALTVIQEFLKIVKNRYNQIVRFFRIDDERTLETRFSKLFISLEIITKRSASYTSAQNEQIERSERIIILRARAMRIAAHLPVNLWSEIVRAADYLNNRTPKRKLQWKTSFEALTDQKSRLSHLHSYESRAYALKNIIPKKEKLESRAFIDHLVSYDSINIYRIWILSRMRVVRTRNVTFDENRFYDLTDLDRDHMLKTTIEDVIQVLEIFETEFQEVIIQEDFDIEENLDRSESSRNDQTFDSSKQEKFSNVVQMMTSKSTSNRDVQDVNQSSKSTRNRRMMKVQLDSVIMSTRSRKQTYATALTSTLELESYYSAFFIELERSDQVKNSERLHRDSLSIESRYWKKMLNHRFFQKFNLAVIKELSNWKNESRLSWLRRKISQQSL